MHPNILPVEYVGYIILSKQNKTGVSVMFNLTHLISFFELELYLS